MGIFGKSMAGLIIDAITDSKSSTSTTVPTGIKLGGGSILDTLEKLDTVLMDVDTEGKKRGYEIAAKEYDAAYKRIENEYLTVNKIFDQQTASKDAEASRLISKLQQLEEYKKHLEHRVIEKTKQVSNKYNIPVSSVFQSLAPEISLMDGMGVLDLIYRYKSQKLEEAEKMGYVEACRLYKRKIKELKDNIELLKKKGNAELQELSILIADAIKEISDAEIKIAELEIALNS